MGRREKEKELFVPIHFYDRKAQNVGLSILQTGVKVFCFVTAC